MKQEASLRLDHIGIVVRDLEATAVALERALGLKLEGVENYEDTLRIGFLPLKGLDLELIEPLTDEGLNAQFLQKRGEGVHHLAFAVEDLQAALDHALDHGAELLLAPCRGARGRQIAFLEGQGLGGTIVELVAQAQAGDEG